MFRSGLNPILVKVAGVGLSVGTVGKDLASMMPTFRKLVSFQSKSHLIDRKGHMDLIPLVKVESTRL